MGRSMQWGNNGLGMSLSESAAASANSASVPTTTGNANSAANEPVANDPIVQKEARTRRSGSQASSLRSSVPLVVGLASSARAGSSKSSGPDEEDGTIGKIVATGRSPDKNIATEKTVINDVVAVGILNAPAPPPQPESTPGAYASDGQPYEADPQEDIEAVPEPPPSNNDNPQDLAVADAVDPNLPEAVPENTNEKVMTEKIRCLILALEGTLGAVLVLVVLVIVLVVMLSRKDSRDTVPASEPSKAPSPAPTVESVESKLLPGLPEFTKNAIGDASSPQAMALDWMLGDPNGQEYSQDRLVQRYALAVFYYATGGDEWYDNTDWLSYNVSECEWHQSVDSDATMNIDYLQNLLPENDGMVCADSTERVRQIQFLSNNLKGQIPQEIVLLKDLEDLSTWAPGLGVFSLDYVHLLSNLQILSLPGTGVSGTLPEELATLSGLRLLSLQGTPVTGTIPTWIGTMTSLQSLQLDETGLTGTIPSQLGQLTNLLFLYFGAAGITGTIPKQALVPSLMELFVGQSGLTGSIPTDIGLLSDLVYWAMFQTLVSGPLPSQLGQLSNMEHITLFFNEFSSTVPTELGLLDGLFQLYLGGNRLTGTIPSELGMIPFHGNKTEGSFSMESRRVRGQTTYLALFNESMVGTIPSQLGQMHGVQRLRLSMNSFTGTLATELGGMESLKWFVTSDNELTSSLPSELAMITTLTILEVFGNSLTGSLPEDYANWEELSKFHVSNNVGLTGSIPESYYQVWFPRNSSGLEVFRIAGTSLTGTLPETDSLCGMKEGSLTFGCPSVCGCDCFCSSSSNAFNASSR